MMTLWNGSTTKTATFTTAAIFEPNVEYVALFVSVSAVTGTSPTLTVKLQESPDGNVFYDIPSFTTTSITTTGNTRIAVPTVGMKCANFVQAVCTIGGTTPVWTFLVQVADCNSKKLK